MPRRCQPATDLAVVLGQVRAGEAIDPQVGDRAAVRIRSPRRHAPPRPPRRSGPCAGCRRSCLLLGADAGGAQHRAVAPEQGGVDLRAAAVDREDAPGAASRKHLQLIDRRRRLRRDLPQARDQRPTASPVPPGQVCSRTTAPSPCARTPSIASAAIAVAGSPGLPVLQLHVPVDVAIPQRVSFRQHARVVVARRRTGQRNHGWGSRPVFRWMTAARLRRRRHSIRSPDSSGMRAW